jgi:hypothetical protein
MRVLVKNQTAQADNGIYAASSSGWTRTADANTWDELVSAFTFVHQGTTQADTGWVCTIDPGGTLGVTPITWTQFSGAGTLTVPLVRKGFLYREMLFIVRDNAGARSNAIITDAVLRVDNVDHWNGSFAMWRHVTWERNRLISLTPGTAVPTGVAQQSWAHDWDGLTGGETRDQYLPTTPGSIAEMRLTASAAGSLTILVNDVTPTQAAIAAGIVKV